MLLTEDLEVTIKICPDDRDLNYDKYFSHGNIIKIGEDYTSENTSRLNERDDGSIDNNSEIKEDIS